MSMLLTVGVLVGVSFLIFCGLIANLFFYSHGLFRAEHLQQQREERLWKDFWSRPHSSSDADRLVQ